MKNQKFNKARNSDHQKPLSFYDKKTIKTQEVKNSKDKKIISLKVESKVKKVTKNVEKQINQKKSENQKKQGKNQKKGREKS